MRNYRARAVKDGKPAISEKLFQEQIRKAAILTGWLYYHTFNAYRSPEGFPDCVLVHPKQQRLIIAELKSEHGDTSPKQDQWLTAFATVPNVEVFVLRPADFDWFWELLKEPAENSLTISANGPKSNATGENNAADHPSRRKRL